MRSILFPFAVVVLAASFPAQSASSDALIDSSKAFFNQSKNILLRSADKVPEDLWSYRPTPEVRTFGQLFAHIADAQYEFCGMATEGKAVDKGIEKSATTRSAVIDALKEAFAYCDAAYAKMTPAQAVAAVSFFGQQRARISVMDANISHNAEHYGNLVTYMRMKNIVPPSSEKRR